MRPDSRDGNDEQNSVPRSLESNNADWGRSHF